MKSVDVCKIWNDTASEWFALKPPVNVVDICMWLIWNDGIVYPPLLGNMTQRMNEIAMDMLLRGDY